MSSQTTETSSDEDSNFTETESCTIDNNSQPVLLKNPFFYYKTENVSESMESCSSIFDHETDSDSDDSVISQVEETMSDSLDNKIEMDNSQNERGNEIVLKNFPGRITIKYSPRTPEKSDPKIERISEERGVQTDRTRDSLNDRATVKEEPQSQNNEMIKEEENEAINNGANEDPLHYRRTKEENHSQVLEEVDAEDEKVFIPEVQSRDDVDELNEEESNVFQIEVTLVEMDVEASQDDIKVEQSTNEYNANRLETPEFHEEVKNEIKTDANSQNASEAGASLPGINGEGARADAITIMDVEAPQDDTTDDIKAEHSTNENDVNRSETPESHEEVKNEIKTESSSQNSADVDVSSRRINVQVARENVIIVMDVETPQDNTTDDIKVEHSTNDNYVNPSETSEFHERVKNEMKTDSSSSNASEAGIPLPRMNVKVSRENVITSNFQNEIHLQPVQGDDSDHEEKLHVKLEDVREKSIPQNPEGYAVPRNVDGSAQANVDINVKFGEMEFEEVPEEPGNRCDAGAGGDNDLQMNISGVDVPQVQMEVEELQGQLSNDENNRNLCNGEQSMVQEQMPVVDKPRIYVKSRTQLFPDGYRSLNSTQEEISEVPSDPVHNEKRIEAESQRSDDSSDDEWLKSGSARVEATTNKEPPKSPDESQDLVRRRGIRTKILPQLPQQPIADPLNDVASIKTERPRSPCSSEAETVILPWKLEKGTQVSPQARGKRVTQSDDSVSNETSTATDTSQKREEKERIVYSLASKFYRGKPFSPQEDRIIVDFVVSHYGKDRSLPRDAWKALAGKPEMRHRTTRSLENRYERYLRGRAQHYVKDPEIRKWFVNPTRKKKQAPRGTLKNYRSSDDDSEDEL